MVVDRKRLAMLARSSRTPFFSLALESEYDGPRVAEDAMEGGTRSESGEAVQVAELSWCWHAFIVTRFRGREKAISLGNNSVFTALIGKICPLRDAKSPKR